MVRTMFSATNHAGALRLELIEWVKLIAEVVRLLAVIIRPGCAYLACAIGLM